MAEGTASLLEHYANRPDGGGLTLEERIAAAWRAAAPGDEILHGVQHIGVVADPGAMGGTMKAKLDAMDAAAKLYAAERTKENPDKARANGTTKAVSAAISSPCTSRAPRLH